MESAVRSAATHAIPLLVDPKIPHIDYYAGATVVTPNHHEAEAATHMRVRSADEASAAAASVPRSRPLRSRADDARRPGDVAAGEGRWKETCPASAREVADVTGAGDTVIATMALAMAAGATLVEAARLANEAAGIAVGKFGAATVTPVELLRALEMSAER